MDIILDILEKIDKDILIKCLYILREQNLLKVIRFPKLPGLFYIKNIIKGSKVYNNIDKTHYFKAGTSASAREVIQYGKPFIYQGQKKDDVPIRMIFPDYIKELRRIAIKKCELLDLIPMGSITNKKLFNQCIINKYEPGEKIGAHIDAGSYGQLIACFSILSGITMVFKNKNITEPENVFVEDGSLYIMSGPARWDWTHEIKGLKTDLVGGRRIPRTTRISITFRSNNEDLTNSFEE